MLYKQNIIQRRFKIGGYHLKVGFPAYSDPFGKLEVIAGGELNVAHNDGGVV